MHTRPTRYGLEPADIVNYLDDLEIRWGIKVSLEIHMRALQNGEELLSLKVVVPHEIHRRELDFVPDVHRVLGRDAARDFWSEAYAVLYDFDHALAGGNNY